MTLDELKSKVTLAYYKKQQVPTWYTSSIVTLLSKNVSVDKWNTVCNYIQNTVSECETLYTATIDLLNWLKAQNFLTTETIEAYKTELDNKFNTLELAIKAKTDEFISDMNNVVGEGFTAPVTGTFGTAGNYKTKLAHIFNNLVPSRDYEDNGADNTQIKQGVKIPIYLGKGGTIRVEGYPNYSRYKFHINGTVTDICTDTSTSPVSEYPQTVYVESLDSSTYFKSLSVTHSESLTKSFADLYTNIDAIVTDYLETHPVSVPKMYIHNVRIRCVNSNKRAEFYVTIPSYKATALTIEDIKYYLDLSVMCTGIGIAGEAVTYVFCTEDEDIVTFTYADLNGDETDIRYGTGSSIYDFIREIK